MNKTIKRNKYVRLEAVKGSSYGLSEPDEQLYREAHREHFKALRAMKLAMRHLSRKSTHRQVLAQRSYMKQAIQNVRYSVRRPQNCDKLPRPNQIALTYERGEIREAVQGYREDYAYLKERLREKVRFFRQDRRRLESESHYYELLGQYVATFGGVHLKPGTWLSWLKYRKTKKIRESKAPKTNEAHVGLELEFCSPLGKEDLGALLTDANLADYVQLKSDGSIRPDSDEHCAHEIAILCQQSEAHDIVPRVTAVLRKAKSYVNASCGFHVHLDMRYRDREASWKKLRMAQPLMYKMVPHTRRKNQYCKPVRTLQFDTARRAETRYLGINCQALREHGTLEIRLHSSTLDARKILNWVDLLVYVLAAPVPSGQIKTALGLQRAVGIPDSLRSYVEERVKTFESQHAAETDADMEEEAPAQRTIDALSAFIAQTMPSSVISSDVPF